MKRIIHRTLTFFCFLGLLMSTASFAAGAPIAPSLAPMLQKVLPAIVNIHADIKITDVSTLARIEREKGQELSNGEIPNTFVSIASGVIVDADKGYILTNAHVVNDAQNITITLSDSRHYTAKLIGLDKPSDVALLQIKAKSLTAIPIGNSNNLKVGDYVAAIGNPFGLNQTVTSGIVSALGRATLGIESLENFIQTDAPINPGNSGGALLNTQGELIGINTAILGPGSSIGIGFAIPSNMAKTVMQQLIQYGDVRRGALGIGAQDISPDLATAFKLNSTNGAVVTLVKLGSPAEKTGFAVGDIIKTVNGDEVKNANDVVNAVAFLRVDSKVTLTLLRNNKPMTITAELTDPKKIKDASEAIDPFFYGVALKDFTLLSPMHGNISGVLVVSVEDDSHAWQADLRPGDVITSANQQKVENITDLKKIAAVSKPTILLNVLRGPGAVFLVINKEDS